MISKNRTITILLAAVLALSLLLTACNSGGDTTPTGGNTTSGSQTTPDATDPSTDAATEPDNTPSEAESSSPDTNEAPTEIQEPKYNMPPYDEAQKAELDEYITHFNSVGGIDIENVINEVYEKYGEYINVNITKDAIRVGIITGDYSAYYKSDGSNLTGISPNALKKVNDFLADNGEEELDSEVPEQNIAVLWLAASLYYDPDYVHESDTYKDDPCNDIAMAFGLARADSSREGDAELKRDAFWSAYVNLFGGPFVIEDYQ